MPLRVCFYLSTFSSNTIKINLFLAYRFKVTSLHKLVSKMNSTLSHTGYQNNLKVLYSQVPTPVSIKKSRYISSVPERILDAPDIKNDFCELIVLHYTMI